jgi:phenylacetate-CoA ligase
VKLSSTAWTLGRLLRDSARSHGEIKRLASSRLKAVLEAATGVPHYRSIMERLGYDPRRDYRGPEDLSVWPVTGKAHVKADHDAMLREGARQYLDACFVDRTSGSTGIPLTIYRRPDERAVHVAKWLRVLIGGGYRPHDRVLSFTAPGRLGEGRSGLQRFGLFRRRAVDFTLPAAACADAVLDYRPHVLYGNRTSLIRVADELARRGMCNVAPKLVVATGEIIDAPDRAICRQVFGTEITETYGSVEMGVMAYQQQGDDVLSLIEDCTFFEFLDEQGRPAPPGQPARVVVTDLFGQLMPLIRYEQGDFAVYAYRENERGERVRVIEQILGRQDAVLHLPDGRSLTFLDFYDVRYGFPELRRLRITQTAPDALVVDVVADSGYFDAIRQELERRLRRIGGPGLRYEVRRVEEIPPDPNGKLRCLVSTLAQREDVA